MKLEMENIKYVLRRSESWIGKYRPKTLKDIKHQEDAVWLIADTLKTTAKCPHMLFYGPPGVGKTSTALAVAHQLFRPEVYESRVVELSARDSHVMEVVHAKIESFDLVPISTGAHRTFYRSRPYKIFIIEDADLLTEYDQKALLWMIHTYSYRTTFILISLHITSFIVPLATTCASLRFNLLPERSIRRYISKICEKEDLIPSKHALSAVCYLARGSLGMAIQYLQRAARSFRPTISRGDVYPTMNPISREDAERFLRTCKFDSVRRTSKKVNDICKDYGCNASMLVSEVFDAVVEAEDLSDDQRTQIFKCLIEADKRLAVYVYNGLNHSYNEIEDFLLLELARNLKKVLCDIVYTEFDKPRRSSREPDIVYMDVDKPRRSSRVPDTVYTDVDKPRRSSRVPDIVYTDVDKPRRSSREPAIVYTDVDKPRRSSREPAIVYTDVDKPRRSSHVPDTVYTDVDKPRKSSRVPKKNPRFQT